MKILLKLNYSLLILPLMIFSMGMVTLYASSPEKARSQLFIHFVGLLVYAAFSYINYTITKSFWKYILSAAIALLVFVELLGVSKLGSARWLNIGLFTFQPSEIAKLALIISLSAFIVTTPDFRSSLKSLVKLLTVVLPLIILVFLQPDLGTTIILIGTLILVLFYSGISKFFFLFMLIAGGLLSTPAWNALKDYQKIRVLVFLNPQLDVLGHGYNVIQSIISIGSGGLLGKGFGHGLQTQLDFLPVHWTDFIFASFAEEWGYIGVVLLIVLYCAFLISILYIAYKTKDNYGSLLAIGIFSIFLIQFVVNVGMNLGLLPVTGITLPFVSHGGSSLLVSFIMLGMLQNIWIQRRVES